MKKKLKYVAVVGVLKHLPGMHYIEVPARVIAAFGGGFKRRFVVTLVGARGRVEFQGGLMALGAGRGYISVTKKRLVAAGLRAGAFVGARVRVELSVDESRFGMKVCEELAEVLRQDAVALARFEGLTPGKQRYIIQYVGAVKNSDLRLERAMLLLGNLKELAVGHETFRGMLGLAARRG